MRINIASATNIFPYDGWINYDREDISSHIKALRNYPDHLLHTCPLFQQNIITYLKSGGNIDFRVHDLRNNFSHHESNSIDGIYLGQMVEHLNPIYEIPKFLTECHRMLKPNGVIRITTPNLDLLIQHYISGQMDKFIPDQPDFYKGADPSAQLAFLMYGACGPACTWDHYDGHMFLFTPQSMTTMLTHVGFKDIVFYTESGKSKDSVMAAQVYDAGMSHSLIAEAIK